MARIPSSAPFSDLVNLEVPGAGAEGERYVTETRRSLAGIALSGGGIRSATFNLGLLQALQRMDLLRGFDYVSTVSGGGYVGGFWTRWRSRLPSESNRLFPEPDPATGAEATPIRHLREFSNFLTPRLGLLTVDSGRALVAVVGGLVPSLLAAVSVTVLALLAWLGVAHLLLVPDAVRPDAAWMPGTVLASVTGALLLGLEGITPRDTRRAAPVTYLVAAALGVGATLATWWWTGAPAAEAGWTPGLTLPLGMDPAGAAVLLAPAAALAGGAAALLVLRFVTSRCGWVTRRRAPFERVQSRLWLFAAIWTVAVGAWWAGSWLTDTGAGTVTAGGLFAVLSVIFGRVQRALSVPVFKRITGKRALRLFSLAPQLLAYAALAALVVLLAALLAAASGEVPLRTVAATALGVLAATLLLYEPGQIGLHAFYRGRLSRAYLGASLEPRMASSEEVTSRAPQHSDDVPIGCLAELEGPVHLVCCAANDLADASEPHTLQRGAVSAVVSPRAFSVDAAWTPWPRPDDTPTLGAAITASAAAFNSLMGARSIEFGPASRFLAAALGLRLGLWLPHPHVLAADLADAPGRLFVGEETRVVGKTRLRDRVRAFFGRIRRMASRAVRRSRRRAERVLVGWRFFRELFGQVRANGREVHLSDGAHFENLGVYELIRRHCRFILLSDCGADPERSFADMGNVVRKVRTDFGVDVRIDLTPLRPDADGLVRQHMVAGDVYYPNGDTGILLVFKPGLAASEPADVREYATRNAAFPHETTIDQFYDEAQWEAYRRLGEHAADDAFRRVLPRLPEAPPARLAEAFARARFEWLPAPDGFDARAAGIGAAIGGLDALLRRPECASLHAEVYRELPEPAVPAPPASDALPASLEVVRRALKLMEDVFRSERLERSGSHPAYLGLVNHFARWTAAPLVRGWWPVLKTLHSQPFVRWMEATFGLRSPGVAPMEGPQLASLAPLDLRGPPTGFASRAWVGSRVLPEDGDGRVGVSYTLMVRHGERENPVQAGILLCRLGRSAIAWDADDFFIPAGFWGCGFGTDFLRRMRTGRDAEFLMTPAGDFPPALVVRVVTDPCGDAESRKRVANEVQMYRTAGFSEATVDEDDMLQVAGEPPSGVSVAELPWQRSSARWMLALRDLEDAHRARDDGQGGTAAVR